MWHEARQVPAWLIFDVGQEMKAKRLILILSPFACVLLYVFVISAIDRKLPRATSEGSHLSIGALKAGEEIAVTKIFSHRDVVAREYRIVGGEESPRVTVFALSASWENNRMLLIPEKVLVTRSLSKRETEGLDEMVSFFRRSREEYGSGEQSYRLSYFRDGKKIGEEFFVGYSLASLLTYFWRAGYKGDSTYDSDYSKLAKENQVTREQIDKMIAFEMLETDKPNKAPEPTPVAVTPRATEGVSK